ncbi:molybdopterin-dependent oxidoreductase [Nocardia asteroides]|uniref:molybdopterin-dependent oxidoreductase n=1 Tax=Nocardia asteroides TaxID=1824 RepID=UPI0037C5BFF6
MTVEEKVTFCRICEPFCGMIATVEDGRLLGVRPDPDHPLSKGFACPKGMAYPEVQNDPDRVVYPLRRRPDGTFERVSWDSAITEIATRMNRILDQHGPDSAAMYLGNPGGLNYSNALWSQIFLKTLDTKHLYSASSQDVNSLFVANHLLFGQMLNIPIPDLHHTEMVVLLGANPLVSHMSMCCVPRISDVLHAVEDRGGRVLVIDPRRTETAHEFEWLPVVPDSDAWLLLSLVHVLFEEGLVDEEHARNISTGWESLRVMAEDFAPEVTEVRTQIPAATARDLARQLAGKRAAIYGRTGTSLGSSPTLVNYLICAVNLLSGNLDRRGGSVFGDAPLPLIKADIATGAISRYKASDTRIGSLPVVLGGLPAAVMAAEMTTPGPGQVRALFVTCGNPVLSIPDGPSLVKALGGLDLMVSIDLYITETNKYADFILPGSAMYEREDLPVLNGSYYLQPFLQATPAVVPLRGEARLEADIFQMIGEAMGRWPFPNRFVRSIFNVCSRLGRPITPRRVLDILIRLGRNGDRFGLRRGGLNLERLLNDHPHGVLLEDRVGVGRVKSVIRHKDKRVHLDHPEIHDEVARLGERVFDPEFPLLLIGQREPRSENSWMHNVARLRSARAPHGARMHPRDVAALGLSHFDPIRLVSRTGQIELPVIVTDDISPGVVAVPHGWGHVGGSWQRSNNEPGANVNELASADPAYVEKLSGTTHLSGIPVRAERTERQTDLGE